jgi:hypothetical protein
VGWRLDRLGRNLRHLILLIDELTAVGVGFVSLNEGIDTTTAAGRLQLHVLGDCSSRARARPRTCEGRAGARQETRAETGPSESHPPLSGRTFGADSPSRGDALGRLKEHRGTTTRGRTVGARDKPAVIRSDFRHVFSGRSSVPLRRGTMNRLSSAAAASTFLYTAAFIATNRVELPPRRRSSDTARTAASPARGRSPPQFIEHVLQEHH